MASLVDEALADMAKETPTRKPFNAEDWKHEWFDGLCFMVTKFDGCFTKYSGHKVFIKNWCQGVKAYIPAKGWWRVQEALDETLATEGKLIQSATWTNITKMLKYDIVKKEIEIHNLKHIMYYHMMYCDEKEMKIESEI